MRMRRVPLVALMALLPFLAAGAAAAEDPRVEALFAAARAGDVAGVTRLLDAGLDANAKGRYDQTALFAAADQGRLAVVELLLARGATVTVRDTFYGATPLTWALDGGHAEIARRLVEAGAAEPEAALELAVKEKDERPGPGRARPGAARRPRARHGHRRRAGGRRRGHRCPAGEERAEAGTRGALGGRGPERPHRRIHRGR